MPMTDAVGKVVGYMDKATHEYLESNAPDPTQHNLNAMLDKVTRMRLIDGGTSKGKALGTQVLLDVTDAQSIVGLRHSLAIIEDKDTFSHCMRFGDYAMEFYKGHRFIATIGLHHGRSIRWDAWKNDALLRNGMQLLTWLADRGITAPLEAYKEDQRRAEVHRQEENRWKHAMPECLAPYWEEMQSSRARTESLQDALEAAYPNPELRALELFRWFGSGAGKWNGFPSYESIPETLLLDFPTDLLLSALAKQALTPQQLEGAARYFAGWEFAQKRRQDLRQIPVELRQRLLEHVLQSSDEDKVRRAQSAFSA